MTELVYDYAIDMSDSSVFYQGFWDNDGYLYLVFQNGTVVSRDLSGFSYTEEDVRAVDSWGGLWNTWLKNKPVVEGLDMNDVSFVHRDAADSEQVEDTVDEPVASEEFIDAENLDPEFVEGDDEDDEVVDNYLAAVLDGSMDLNTVELRVVGVPAELLGKAVELLTASGGFIKDNIEGSRAEIYVDYSIGGRE